MGDQLSELKRKRDNIKATISERVIKGKPTDDKVEQYLQIVSELEALGFKTQDSSPRLLQALAAYKGQKPIIQPPKSPTKPVEVTPDPPKVNPHIQDYEYKLVLAWTCKDGNEPSQDTLNLIMNYLNSRGAKQISKNSNSFGGYSEHTIEYKWTGINGVFEVIRDDANFILDTFVKNEYERFNISVFGSKKK